ncbi:MAG TPA: ribonuclease J [Candidatus Saccharibacteria bacterium]|nr:ribonuclease J [Candidatus Saccharibacteria bacterium]HMR38002.1 ribonuclease J [Candidatus Saccharibacteria bacterium]
MGQRRLAKPQADDANKRPHQPKKSNNTVLNATTTRKGEVFRAQRRTSETVQLKSSQHVINVPVNKSVYNGYGGKQFSIKDQPKGNRTPRPTLKIIPIGGVGEMGIGKNMTAFEYDNDIVVVDMGFLFPGGDYPGINYITPDVAWLEENKHKIRGHVFTHGHLDHIGAFRHLVPKIPAPVYGSKFTVGMLQRNMEESDGSYEPDYHILDPEMHEQVQLGDSFSVELVRVNHSIPDATAVVIRTPLGVVLCSGDWRFEDDPVDGKKFDMDRMTEIATKEGILVFLNESTNCESEGSNLEHSEHDIQHSIGEIMDMYSQSRIIISSFSSMLHRMQLILEEAKKHDRKVAFSGYSIIQNLEVALRSGVIKIPKDVVVKMEDIVKLPDNKVTVVCTGSQGEFNAVLNRMASGAHKFLKVKANDVIVFSSSVVPGNEKYVVRTVDGLMREGGEVLQDRKTHLTGVGRLHLSGHGYYEDHVKLINALNPKYYIPNHGEFHMLVHNARLAEKENGIPRDNIFVCDAGDVVEITPDGAQKVGRIPVGGVMYDDSGAVVSEVVLKDRIHMSQEGMFIVVLTIQRGTGRLLTSPDIISRGFIYMRDSEELMNMIRQYLKQKAARGLAGKKVDMDAFKKELRDEITHILYDQTRRTPIVIPVVNEVGGGGKKPGGDRPQGEQRAPQPPQKAGVSTMPRRKFPSRQVPDSPAQVPHGEREPRIFG